MSAQLELFAEGEPRFDLTFAARKRFELPPDAWVELVPGWLRGHQQLFDTLVATVHFRAEQRMMYERKVAVPRLCATLGEDGPSPPVVEAMRRALSLRYGEKFSRVSLGYYRDGRDSVAFHGDRIARVLPSALVATVSVGAARGRAELSAAMNAASNAPRRSKPCHRWPLSSALHARPMAAHRLLLAMRWLPRKQARNMAPRRAQK